LPRHEKIHFLALLQSENRIQIPVEVRQHLDLEPGNFLRIKLQSTNNWISNEEFFARLSQDGRITVPWEVRWKLQIKPGEMMRVLLDPED
jgi:bifunctional DNA-binding transcriptional regulator/antitoxin component of YhaV-PrlF toxin-antitoxin module